MVDSTFLNIADLIWLHCRVRSFLIDFPYLQEFIFNEACASSICTLTLELKIDYAVAGLEVIHLSNIT